MIRDPETFEALLDSVRRFVRERLVPAEAQVAETDEIPEDIVQEMREMGLFGLTIPEAYGGLELTMEEESRLLFELCKTSPAFRSVIGTTVGIGSQGILMDGTPEQKAHYLPKLATGELSASFALTEPDVGSSSRSTRASTGLAAASARGEVKALCSPVLDLTATVERVVYLGTDLQLLTRLPTGEEFHIRLQNSARTEIPAPGTTVALHLEEGAARLLAD